MYELISTDFLISFYFMSRVRSDFELAVEGIKKHLIRRSEPHRLLFIGELLSARTFSPKMVRRRFEISLDTPAGACL